MKTSHYIGLCYVVSIGAAGGVSYLRGKRGLELAKDAALYGAALGTTTAVIGYLSRSPAKAVTAKPNFSPLAKLATANTLGKLSAGGVKLLSNLDTDKLYANMKKNGVKVAPLPDNPSIVVQDAT